MNPDPLYIDDEPWPLYPAPPRRNHRWLIAALAVLALIAWRTRKP
jgi:MYXO-CTERM domain-containing protein